MERTREPRRGIMAATNGGLSRRRQRNSCPRDSPEDDGGMEMHETARLRDRGSKKDRDRDRSSRSKRRRGERMLHGSNRDEGDDSSEESVDEEEDDDEDDAAVAVRLLPPPPPPNPAPSSLQQNHHHRKSFPPKIMRVPPWKAADEIGVPIPKKARSASAKRSHECWVSGGGGGGGEQIQWPPSTSPSGLSLATTAQISSTSNVSIRKKMKPISGTKQRSPKMSKSSWMQEEIEIEVAEVLYKMTRQTPPMQEANQIDSQDANGSSNEAKWRIPSPNSISPPPTSQISVLPPSSLSSNAPLSATAPKRKHPRPVKFEDEFPVTLALQRTSLSSAAPKMGTEPPLQSGAGSPKSENTAASLYSENGVGSTGFGASMAIAEPPNVEKEFGKPGINSVPELKVLPAASDGGDRVEIQEDAASPKIPTLPTDLASSLDESTTSKGSQAAGSQVSDNHRREKFRFDLMALPTGKSSLERDSSFDLATTDHNSVGREIELVSKLDDGKRGEEATKMARQNTGENSMKDKKTEKLIPEEWGSKNPMAMEKTLDLEKFDKHQLQKQQSRDSRMEPIPENAPPASLPMPMHDGWPGSFPPFGFVGQVPSLQAVVPMDVAAGSSSTLQPPPNFLSPPVLLKRCATHCYIARNIYFQERIARMNHPFWPAATSTAAMFGAKPMNLNAVPPPESAFLINPLQGSFPARSLCSLQDNKPPPFVAAFAGHHHPEKEKISTENNNFMEGVQRKQVVVQQTPLLPGSASNMLGPAFIFPLHQQQAVAAAAATAVRSGAAKSAPGVGNAAPSSTSAVASTGAGVPVAALNFGYAPITPNDAQYLAILQNSAYPFPIPAHVGGPPPYRGAPPPQAIPFFNGSFYSPQMLQQLQLQQQLATQQTPHAPQKHQNTSTSSGSSSSQKHPQKPHRGSGGGAGDAGASPRSFPTVKQQPQLQAHQARQLESETGCGDSPSSAGSRVSQAQKSIYGHNSAIPIHPPSRALKSTAAAALGSGGGQSEKQESAHAFSMPFASFNTGATPPALDFTSVAPNQALFQSLPEAARHGYQISTVAAATAAMASAVQHKKVHLQPREDGKYAGAMNANMSLEVSSKTRVASSSQHSLAFSRPDNNEPPISFRELNSIPPTANGSRASDPSCSTGAVAPTASANTPNSQHIQQQQRQLQLQQLAPSRTKTSTPNINTGVCSDRHPAGSTVNKFPQTMAGFPQGIMQGGSPAQSPQWKAVSMKNHFQQQRGAAEQTPPTTNHQTQISFGTNPFNAAHTSNVSTSSAGVAAASTTVVGSPTSSVSKITGGSSRVPTSGKLGPPATALPLTQQSSSKITVSCSSLNSSPNRNAPSILGHPHFTPVTNSSTGQQLPQLQPQYQRAQKQQQQILQKQPQVFFSNTAYMQSQPLHSSAAAAAAAAAAAGFYQRRQPEQHPQQQSSHPVSNGMLALCSSALPLSGSPTTSDAAAAKAVCSAAANSMKGLPPAGLIHAAHLAAAAQSASIAAFPFMSMPPLSVKPVAADQTATIGNDNLNACWKPDKR